MNLNKINIPLFSRKATFLVPNISLSFDLVFLRHPSFLSRFKSDSTGKAPRIFSLFIMRNGVSFITLSKIESTTVILFFMSCCFDK